MDKEKRGDLSGLAQPTRARLDELKAALEKALGEDLVALIVYGSAARGGWRDGESDVDVAVVLADAARPKLEAISNALQMARYAARIEAIVLTAAEIPHAADVFPLLYDDIQRCHVVLSGRSPFEALTIADRHLRLRIEQELREAQIRLRRAVVDARGGSGALAGAVLRKAKQIREPLRALFGLRGIACRDDLASVLAKASETYGVETKMIGRAKEDPGRAHDVLVELLTKAIAEVDAMDDR